MVYVACGACGHFRTVFLKRQQASLLKKEKAEKHIRDKLILEIGLQNQAAETGVCGTASRASANDAALDTTFS